MKVLIVLTSHDELGTTGRETGFWLEELAAPYYRFKEAGVDVVLASPKGGRPPLDPKSNEPAFQTDETRRFEADPEAMAALAHTARLDSLSADDFDTVFYPGGHGPLWDLAEDPGSVRLIESTLRAGKPLALVCHAPGVLRHATGPDGAPLVRGRKVTGFTNGEEAAVGLTDVVPFLVEDELKRLGGLLQDRRLGALHRHRRPPRHRPEPGLLRTRRRRPPRPPHRSRHVPRITAARPVPRPAVPSSTAPARPDAQISGPGGPGHPRGPGPAGPAGARWPSAATA
ncbi:type 1 glutamine amidotransferase domain-containing protein [Streptomyces sp. enrichment culture]|uniref:type 1 glutamine amidotransferase domain-containing protein n=1 Tax=Streptomyces sp. enrichment culture TaxID=1795815 RepID=UPI003F57FF06